MSSKTKNYLQTQLFPDEDIKQPKHDDIMLVNISINTKKKISIIKLIEQKSIFEE